MRKPFHYFLAGILMLSALLSPAPLLAMDDEAEIRRTLEEQVAEWNRGDIAKFVSYYTEDCVFVGTEVRKGRQQVLERYQRRYPNRDAMGRTTFSEIQVTKLGKGYATVIGRWKVERSQAAGGNVGGLFTLVLHKVKKRWMIVMDHTS